MKNDNPALVSRRALMPLIRYCARNRGALNQVRSEIELKTGRVWNRKNFERWLAQDPQRWTQPLHGPGMLLIEVGARIMRNGDGKAK